MDMINDELLTKLSKLIDWLYNTKTFHILAEKFYYFLLNVVLHIVWNMSLKFYLREKYHYCDT